MRTVRLLETDEDLQAAVERARAFERTRAAQTTRRTLSYERYLRKQPADDLANVHHIDSTRGTELLADLALEENQATRE
jgi:hypothetical protein